MNAAITNSIWESLCDPISLLAAALGQKVKAKPTVLCCWI